MTEYSIVSMTEAADVPAGRIGPKAAGLARLARAGLPVPPAFFITAETYRAHLRDNGIVADMEAAVAAVERPDGRTADLLAGLRDRIIHSPLSGRIAQAISGAVAGLRAPLLAVRSSATREDLPGHSFAGLHDSVLGLRDVDACLAAIKRCWASLWSIRAFEYRRVNGFDHRTVAMAVIVQQLIDADVLGVAFTANPLTGRAATITLEATFGLGEALVGGRITPDRYTFDKKTLRFIGWLRGHKPMASRPGEAGTTQLVPLDAAQTASAALSHKAARRVAKLARRVECVFGGPQDIEWAFRRRNLYVLQSRPITTKPVDLSWEDRQVWTNLNLGEVAPDVMTPVTDSVLCPMRRQLFAGIFKILCVDPGGHPFMDVVAGRLYWNINTGMAVFGHLPGLHRADAESLFGGGHAEPYRTGRLDLADEDLPDLHASFARVLLRLPLTLWDLYTHRPAKSRIFLQQIAAANERLAAVDIPGVAVRELIDMFADTAQGPFANIDLLYVVTSLYALPLTYILTQRWLGDEHGRIAGRLFAGLGGMADAEAGHALWGLARIAAESPWIKQTILAGRSWADTRDTIAQLPHGDRFLAGWDEFIVEHGHHCRGELELYNPRWFERPDYVLDMVRSYIRCLGSKDPHERRQETAEQRRLALDECRARLRNPIKLLLFTHFVRVAAHACAFRENTKNEVVRLIAAGRRALLELGRRLAERGDLSDPDDIFFMRLEEIKSHLEGDIPPDLPRTIAQRRREYEKLCSITPPDIIIGRFDPDNFVTDAVDGSATILRGISASSGVATGKARVILLADSDSHIQPGEVLVAPFTDPGWAPYFLPAAAIVMDQGGILSHGSILAREYGIPAVVNVGPATRIIRTGQTITVDADRAQVRILD